MNKKIAIITGASSGMGREFVRQLNVCLKTIDEIWVIARREERLLELKKSITNIEVKVLSLDICESSDLERLLSLLKSETPEVWLLVNAAGVGRAGRFDEITTNEAVNMVDVNNKALVAVTHMVVPYMVKKSHIIQVASASAFMPQKEFAIYAASKSFVLSFSRALRAELKEKGILVTIVCPGPVDTEFLEISNAGKEQKAMKKLVTAKVEPVVAKALRDAKFGKELSIYGLPMKVVYIASKILPHGLFLK
ncbi:MAG: SDR family NAD(P)-dependent oxidoreductase [Lachnospiraceae bacterium]|nr:SDR family NAD(P)-dependent oxidoreductase [Lachnospiraceae bacterium]